MDSASPKHARHFKRDIIFTKKPMVGFFRYRDLFQIFPADLKGMPQTKVAHRHYPLILEYWYTDEELAEIKVDEAFTGIEDLHRLTSISYNKRDLYMSLLSLATTYSFFTYTSGDARWGFPILDENAKSEINSWSSKWCLEWFHWPNLPEQLKIEKFSDVAIETQRSLAWKWYYMFPDFDWSMKGVIVLPNIVGTFFDAYFQKDTTIKGILNSAIASSNAAMEFMSSRKKIALLSAFTSIETMVNLDSKDFKPSRCDACGQDIFKVSARYRDFLLNYIGKSDSNKRKFNSYYALRSKIVHAGEEFQTEKLFAVVEKGIKDREHLQIAEIVILSKLSILFWAIKHR